LIFFFFKKGYFVHSLDSEENNLQIISSSKRPLDDEHDDASDFHLLKKQAEKRKFGFSFFSKKKAGFGTKFPKKKILINKSLLISG